MLWREARTTIALGVAILFWLLASGWLTIPLLAMAQHGARSVVDPAFGTHAAIVLLGGGTRYDDEGRLVPKPDPLVRIATVADLYASCRRMGGVCTVIVTGGNPQHHEATEADNYLPWLLRRGVPRSDIVLDNRALTTYENGHNVAAILGARHDDEVILVTSAYHMRRALLDFDRFGIHPQPVVSNYRHAEPGILPRVANLEDAEISLHELVGLAQFRVYRMLGWF
ncbi:YdcF family protein [Paraburkholderia phosphatilytica]|uniref:YdcF family protein n=1 Tax=Paraburkholderia phosphatilytica TaxID=2282883 RepID=UPI003B839315